jgi:cbb3-type cytochrome oxidase subunit 3
MKLSDVMSHSGLAIYAEIALILFLLAFAVVVARLLVRPDRRELDRMSRLPLDDPSDTPQPPGARP